MTSFKGAIKTTRSSLYAKATFCLRRFFALFKAHLKFVRELTNTPQLLLCNVKCIAFDCACFLGKAVKLLSIHYVDVGIQGRCNFFLHLSCLQVFAFTSLLYRNSLRMFINGLINKWPANFSDTNNNYFKPQTTLLTGWYFH